MITKRMIHLLINEIKPRLYVCNFCSLISLYHEYANIGHNYDLTESDWIELCPSCHRQLDRNPIKLLVLNKGGN
jgi:hypothetical protein